MKTGDMQTCSEFGEMTEITKKKVKSLIEQEYQVSGMVLEKDGKRIIVEMGSVRHLTNKEMWELMHPDN